MITRLIFYLKNSENKYMILWIILLTSAKHSNFSDFYGISAAVTNKILYIV